MQDISPVEALVEEKTADQLLIEDLMDKVEGLTADLDDAVSVAVSRGAVDWARLNYPDHPALNKGSRAMDVAAAAGVSALEGARAEALAAIAAAKRQIKGQGPVDGVFTEMDVEDIEDFMASNAAFAAAMERHIQDFMPQTRADLNGKVQAVAKMAAEAERAACLGVVRQIAAPVVGTPYSAGPRPFSKAISALPPQDLDKTLQGSDLF